MGEVCNKDSSEVVGPSSGCLLVVGAKVAAILGVVELWGCSHVCVEYCELEIAPVPGDGVDSQAQAPRGVARVLGMVA